MSLGHSTKPAGGTPSAGRGHAEDMRRRVEIGPDRITIRRSIAGIETYVNVPTQSYRGAALRSIDGGDYEIALVHLDPNLEIVVARTTDDSDLIALWRDYARRLALPLLAQDSLGGLRAMEAGGPPSPFGRRRGSPLKNRRPRFLSRRKPASAIIGS